MRMIPFLTGFRLERESRLVSFADFEVAQNQAAETLEASKEWKKNPEMKAALGLYERPIVLTRHPVLQNPVDRAYFYALLAHESIDPTVSDYKDIKRTNPDQNIDPVLPRGVVPELDKGYVLPAGKNLDEEVGMRLSGFLNEERQAGLGAGNIDKGREFGTRVAGAREDWAGDQPLRDEAGIDATVDYYVHCRKQLDDLLKLNNIFIPQEQTIDPGLTVTKGGKTFENLRRAEYFQLLVIVWERGIGEIAKAGLPLDTEKLKKFLKAPDNKEDLERASRMYAERSFEELGPSDTLERFGVTLGPQLRMQYFAMRQGDKPIEPAEFWLSQPIHALAFLDLRLPNSAGNKNFMDGLRAYAEPGSREYPVAADGKRMDEKDVKTILQLVAESCKEYELVATRSTVQREKFMVSRGMNLDSTIEKTGSDVWKFMLDFQKHPIASGVLWLGAIAAAKIAWDTLTAPRARWARWLFLGAMGGVGLGLYQQHKTGKAWWDNLKKSADDFMETDKQKKPEEQTFANYWTDRLQLRDGAANALSGNNHSEAVLATLQEQPVGLVLKWYEDARQTRAATGKLPALPPEFNGKQRRMFGEMAKDDRAALFYNTLDRFFEERGQYVLDHHMDTMYTAGGTRAFEKSQLGFAYIRDKYDSRIMYEVVTTQFKEKFEVALGVAGITDIEAEGLNLRDKEILNRPDILALKTSDVKGHKEVYLLLEKFLLEFRPYEEVLDTNTWSMMDVLFQEADPEILRKMGREATKPADILTRMGEGIGLGA